MNLEGILKGIGTKVMPIAVAAAIALAPANLEARPNYHTVKRGENYSSICASNNVSKGVCDTYNTHLENKDKVRPGQKVFLKPQKGARKSIRRTRKRHKTVNIGKLEARVVEGAEKRKLVGDAHCKTYSFHSSAGRGKLWEECRFYNPFNHGTSRDLPLLAIDKCSDLNKNVSPHLKLKELVRAYYAEKLIPRKFLNKDTIKCGGERFFKKFYLDPNLPKLFEKVRKEAGVAIGTTRKSWRHDGRTYSGSTRNFKKLVREGKYSIAQKLRRHGYRSFVYNGEMYRRIDQTSIIRNSAHTSGKALDAVAASRDDQTTVSGRILRAASKVCRNKGYHHYGHGNFHIDSRNERKRWEVTEGVMNIIQRAYNSIQRHR